MDVIRDTNVGGRLGEALGQGLQMLAQGKLQQMQQQATRSKTFQSLKALGVPHEEAYAFSGMPEKLQEKLLPKYLESLGSREEPTYEPTSGIEQGLAALQGKSQASPVSEIPSMKPEANIVPNALQTPQQNTQNILKQLGLGRGEEALGALMRQPQAQPEAQPVSQTQPQQQKQVQPAAEKIPTIAKKELKLFR